MHCRQKAHSDMTKEVRLLDRFALLSFQWLVAGDSMDRAVEQAAVKKDHSSQWFFIHSFGAGLHTIL